MPPPESTVADPLTADVAGLQATFDEVLTNARRASEQLRECHALLLKLAAEKVFFEFRPVTGAVKVAARELLTRHGILTSQEEQ
jgi:hypothetical protein